MKDIIIGCCGFPCAKKEYYHKFPAVEIQSTFYELPHLDTAKKWRQEAPPDFEFTIKAWQLITHEATSPTYRRLKTKIPENKRGTYGSFKLTQEVFEAWQRTSEIAKALKTRIVLFQCPPSFIPSRKNIRNLRGFFEQIKGDDLLFAWEPRGSWPEELIRDICNDLGLIHCVDPFFMEPRSISPINYFRLHGKPLYNLKYTYSGNDMNRLLDFCKNKTYVFFNNLNMLEDSLRFLRLVRGKGQK